MCVAHVCNSVCVHVCKHVCSLRLSVSPSVHHVHTNEGFGYTPSLSGLLHVHKFKNVLVCVCVLVA